MKAQFFLLTLFLGVILAVHLAMNGKVGEVIGNTPVANAIFWCIGAVTAVIIGAFGWKQGALASLADVNLLLLTAGALGAVLVFAIAFLIPKVGASALFISLLAGQVITGMVLSHFGWLGSEVQSISLIKFVGMVVMIGGAAMVTFME